MQQWHVYEDWTLEEAPRCFYVGKGNDDRVEKLKRSNCYHREISSELGQCRVVVASSSNEDQILEIERKIISERHTYVKDPEYNGIGCNLTKGGQGNSGRVVTLETRQKISQSKLCKTPNRIWTQEDRNAVSERMSRLHKGKKLTDDHLNILKERMANPDIKKEMMIHIANWNMLCYMPAGNPTFAIPPSGRNRDQIYEQMVCAIAFECQHTLL